MPDFVTPIEWLAVTAVLSYFLGAVPFGIVMARLFRLGNLRTIGSGNIGATNVLRTGNKLAAFLTLIGDAGKGGFAVLMARTTFGEDAAQVAALLAFLGHAYPVWLGFRGGKGVATFLGTMLALAWPLGLAACGTWLAAAAVTRISSLGAIVAAASVPFWALMLRPEAAFLATVFAVMVVWFHRGNISRLRRGEEPRIGRK
ncbi:G3P acyltransferase [Jannaschia seosinensis]|uniref:Glycerol-3-phosphate acyltransferase n=1 Tax=Jannaschia seosinensis TaxID=313367 RepID=A0A0M7BBP6_9RHOB|nr:glycerol-3-phosphate 1-O-acyltransferase PlsY [Jannaschia seosinensis]CUH38376.1 G3P acyltransferase [Jannaschia seosinensis]